MARTYKVTAYPDGNGSRVQLDAIARKRNRSASLRKRLRVRMESGVYSRANFLRA
jgi:hypothetical protein